MGRIRAPSRTVPEKENMADRSGPRELPLKTATLPPEEVSVSAPPETVALLVWVAEPLPGSGSVGSVGWVTGRS